MPRYRLARQAAADLAHVLEVSEERWGPEGRRRYSELIVTAVRKVAASPTGVMTRERPEVGSNIRSFHLRHARDDRSQVKSPVHILYYRIIGPELIEIVRVLHERMEPSSHFGRPRGEE